MPPWRIHWRDRQEESTEKDDVPHQRRPSDAARQHSPRPRHMAKPCGQQNRSARIQDRIPRRHVITATFSQNEKREWHYKHPPEYPESPSTVTRKIEKQSAQCHRQREGSQCQLVWQEIPGPADAHIARVDGLEELQRNEIVPPLPEQI